mmetsp:Transcript_30401/g.50304  ORF Transcript_30401/g.50304 Transcript_30401/m.50304 type:complete len:357 (-) Transcript_30401:262-1332(-)
MCSSVPTCSDGIMAETGTGVRSAGAMSRDGQSGSVLVALARDVADKSMESSANDMRTREVGECVSAPRAAAPFQVPTELKDRVTKVSAETNASPAVPSFRDEPCVTAPPPPAATGDVISPVSINVGTARAGGVAFSPAPRRSAATSSFNDAFSLCRTSTNELREVTFVSSSSIYAFFRLRLIAADSRFRRMRFRRFSSAGSREPSRPISSPSSEASPLVPGPVSASTSSASTCSVAAAFFLDEGVDFTGVLADRGVEPGAGRFMLLKPFGLPVAGTSSAMSGVSGTLASPVSAEWSGDERGVCCNISFSRLSPLPSPEFGISSDSSTSHMSTSLTRNASSVSSQRSGLECPLLLLW